MRRRPLLRAAVVGGGAYAAGRKVSQHSAQQAEQESAQDERISRLEESGQAQRSARPAPGESVADQLKKLSELHEQGLLSDEEFATAKAKLLAA